MNAIAGPVPEADTQPDEALTGPIVVALREARLVVERILLLSALPPGLVADVREAVLYSQMLGLGGFRALLDSYADLRAAPPAAVSEEGGATHVTFPGLHAWTVAPVLADLAVAAAAAGGGVVVAHGVHAPAELATIAGFADRHGVRVRVAVEADEAVRIEALPAAAAPQRACMDALTWRMVREGFPMLGALWWQLFHLSNRALSPDSTVSRRHAGHIIVREDGSVVGRRDIDDDTDLRLYAVPEIEPTAEPPTSRRTA